ncbi:MAG: rod shape-determining protein RodA [Candidatus Zambryskibacteria bacterium]|nr:rod shape-determining protein RodA [Candidatus Zambryskibacteria bacterium]
MKRFLALFSCIDWIITGSIVVLVCAGLVTMNSFVGTTSFFDKQVVLFFVSFGIFLCASVVDWRFLRRTQVVMVLYGLAVVLLASLFVVGSVFKGAQSWFSIGGFTFQPVDSAKLAVILLLSKYFSRRHVEIAHIRHIIVSGMYVGIIFLLVFLQPDFGSAIIIFATWLGMVLVSGISKKHLAFVAILGVCMFGFLWLFIFRPYQKARIMTFVNPLTDIRGSGYNAYQSVIAVGSGEIFGKGIGYGTQSKLQFLPEYQTDFIFAAFAEEWGFAGVIILLVLYTIVFTRMLRIAARGESNFEVLFGTGLTILFMTHATIHIGMNIGLLPVTGNTLPFMSYGGSHLLNEFLALGILMGMNKYSRAVHKDLAQNEILGIN